MLTYEYAASRLIYEPDTGLSYWKPIPVHDKYDKSWNTRYAGKAAGHFSRNAGYIQLRLSTTLYYAHRVGWLLYYGYNPPDHVDHIDYDKTNNRISNLRLATQAQNNRNRPAISTNASGHKNVYPIHSQGYLIGWQVQVMSEGLKYYKPFCLDQLDVAIAYARELCLTLHGDFAA